MLIFGASGHAKVIYDCILSQGQNVNGVFDDDVNKKLFLNLDIIGTYNSNFLPEDELIIGIGDNKIRKTISKNITHKFGIVKHVSALISPLSKINDGTVIFQGAIIQSSVFIGQHCIINTNSSVDHDSIISDFVHLAPNVTICGGVTIDSGTFVGAGSVIIPNVKIGKNVLIGAGSVVIDNIPDNAKVFGNPAKKYGKY